MRFTIAIDPGTINTGIAFRSEVGKRPHYGRIRIERELLSQDEFNYEVEFSHYGNRLRQTLLLVEPPTEIHAFIEKPARSIRMKKRRIQQSKGYDQGVLQIASFWRVYLESLSPLIQVTYVDSLRWQNRYLVEPYLPYRPPTSDFKQLARIRAQELTGHWIDESDACDALCILHYCEEQLAVDRGGLLSL